MTYYGLDNQIDGIVLDVLIRKHRAIRNSLGISVPVPIETDQLIEAIFEGLLLRENAGNAQNAQLLLPGLEEMWRGERLRDELFKEWDAVSDREKRSRTMFAQETIKVDEVATELAAVQSAIGSGVEVSNFTRQALSANRAVISQNTNAAQQFDLTETPRALRDMMGNVTKFKARFELPVRDGELYLSRTHPIVEGLATYVMDTALDPIEASVAHRCGVIRTSRVERRTTLLLVRLRFHIVTIHGTEEQALLAEDCQLLAFAGSPASAEWISDSQAIEALMEAQSEANVYPEQARTFLSRVIDEFDALQSHLTEVAQERGEELLAAHRRVRAAAQARGVRYRVEPQLPLDVLGIYVYLPVG